jgi:hypothetical protein
MLLSVYLFVSQHCIHIVRDSINFTIDAWSMSPKYAVVSRFTVSAWRAEKNSVIRAYSFFFGFRDVSSK